MMLQWFKDLKTKRREAKMRREKQWIINIGETAKRYRKGIASKLKYRQG